jgi:uncharacterized protein DUF1905/bacteriocin resistance YdeI/OmpD-like protein
MKFRAVVEQAGKTATGIEVPAKVVASLGPSKRPAVRVTINGYSYRSSVASMGGRFMLGISATVREAAGVSGGDKVNVDIDLDTEPREVTVPPDFVAALGRHAGAKRFFDGLSYSNKKRLVLPIEEAKSSETRQRRIDAAVSKLREGRT